MVFYLKDAHVIIQCVHAPLCKFINSVTQNNKVNNWSQEIHSITSHITFENIKGKENVLVDNLSILKTLGLYKDNDPEQVECLAALCRAYVEVLFVGQSSSYVQTTLLVFLCCEATGG